MKKIIILIIIGLIFTGCSNKETDIENETTDNKVVLIDDQNVDKVIINNMNIAYYDNFSHISFNIKNENNTNVKYTLLTIKFYSEDNILMHTTSVSVGTINGKSEMPIFLQTDVDLSEVTKAIYEIS